MKINKKLLPTSSRIEESSIKSEARRINLTH